MHPDEIFTPGPSALVTHFTAAALYPMFPKIMNLHAYDSHLKTRSHFKDFFFTLSFFLSLQRKTSSFYVYPLYVLIYGLKFIREFKIRKYLIFNILN